MAKGQKKSGREAKKPKATKKPGLLPLRPVRAAAAAAAGQGRREVTTLLSGSKT